MQHTLLQLEYAKAAAVERSGQRRHPLPRVRHRRAAALLIELARRLDSEALRVYPPTRA